MILTEICQDLRNWFCGDADRHFGRFEISGGVISPSDFLVPGQYYRIIGSALNDGVHKYGDATDTLTDESFEGSVWAMRVPEAVVQLATDVSAWISRYGAQGASPFASESFKGYSYTRGTNAAGKTATTWKDAFSSRMNMWRKI